MLTAYVWPDQQARLARLRAAVQLAARHPVAVHRQHARSFVEGLALEDGATTVLWHSVMWQYLTAADQAAITRRLDALGSAATERSGLAHVSVEPTRRAPGKSHEFLVVLRSWPGGSPRILGRTVGHGIPTTWE